MIGEYSILQRLIYLLCRSKVSNLSNIALAFDGKAKSGGRQYLYHFETPHSVAIHHREVDGAEGDMIGAKLMSSTLPDPWLSHTEGVSLPNIHDFAGLDSGLLAVITLSGLMRTG